MNAIASGARARKGFASMSKEFTFFRPDRSMALPSQTAAFEKVS